MSLCALYRVSGHRRRYDTVQCEDNYEDEETIYSVRVFRKVFWPLAEIWDIRALASVWWLSVEG